jgi:hypothetical protein
MFNPTRAQLAFVIAVVVGLVLGKLIKNFKVAFAIAVLVGLFVTFGTTRKRS